VFVGCTVTRYFSLIGHADDVGGRALFTTSDTSQREPRLVHDLSLVRRRVSVRAALAAVFKRHRLECKLSQEALAETAGVHRNYIGMVERGKLAPTLDVAKRLADALGASLTALVSEAERT
jgi:DNA-binding XRE family transcriptional regulator